MIRSVQLLVPVGIVVLFLGILGGGCEVVGSSGEGGERNVPSIDHDVRFRVAEDYEDRERPDDPEVFLEMETTEVLRCDNYRIRHELEQRGKTLVVRVLDVELPNSICLTALGPARARRRLSLDSGTYTLILVNGAVRDTYEVSITDRRVNLGPDEGQWTEPSSTLFWRYPRRSFGYYCGATDETKELCDRFVARLQDLPLTSLEVPERGVWSFPLQMGGHHYEAPARFYRYPEEATWSAVKEQLRTFTRQHVRGKKGVSLEVVNWRADIVYSWAVEGEG